MKIKDPEVKEKLILRLHRIEGQVRGLEGMLEDERDCREIVQQLAAVRSAVQGASRYFLQEYAAACMAEMDAGQPPENGPEMRAKREEMIHEMIALLDKAP